MSNDTKGEAKHFSPTLFITTNTVNLVGIAFLLWLILPREVWSIQLKNGITRFSIAFLSISLFNCFLEYFFHRYVLHKSAIGFLSHFYKAHTNHHNLTRIGKRKSPSGKEFPFIIEIENKYPITKPEQDESSFFPWYSFPIFVLVATPVLVVLHIILPSFPWFSAGVLAILCSLTLYEFVHAIEHWPIERWDKLIEHPKFGFLFRKAYSFHLRHHAVIDCNEAISGFFTLPLADFVFGTLVLPKTLYVDGGEWTESEFKSPKPYALIRFIDTIASNAMERRRSKARL